MRIRAIVLILVTVAIVGFLVANWSVFTAPANFHVLFGSVTLPIGIAMLGVIALIVLAFSVFVAFWQGSILMDYRRQAKELQAQRKLADDAEASRFTELSALLRTEVSALGTRLDAAIDAMRAEVRDTEHSIAATLGEMDDRMRRNMGHPAD
jgi:uncharacterized integral membrane protein